jgi:hypothetical protein
VLPTTTQFAHNIIYAEHSRGPEVGSRRRFSLENTFSLAGGRRDVTADLDDRHGFASAVLTADPRDADAARSG